MDVLTHFDDDNLFEEELQLHSDLSKIPDEEDASLFFM